MHALASERGAINNPASAACTSQVGLRLQAAQTEKHPGSKGAGRGGYRQSLAPTVKGLGLELYFSFKPPVGGGTRTDATTQQSSNYFSIQWSPVFVANILCFPTGFLVYRVCDRVLSAFRFARWKLATTEGMQKSRVDAIRAAACSTASRCQWPASVTAAPRITLRARTKSQTGFVVHDGRASYSAK